MSVREARFEELAALVLDRVPAKSAKVVLYTEFDDGVLNASLFYELEDGVCYKLSDKELDDKMFLLQKIFDADVGAMEFIIESAAFSAHFSYKGSITDWCIAPERCDAVLKRHFGSVNVIFDPN